MNSCSRIRSVCSMLRPIDAFSKIVLYCTYGTGSAVLCQCITNNFLLLFDRRSALVVIIRDEYFSINKSMFVFGNGSSREPSSPSKRNKKHGKRRSSRKSEPCPTLSVLDVIPEGDGSFTQLSNSYSTADTSFASSACSSSDGEEPNPYKPRFHAPMDLLETATNPATPKAEALNVVCKLHAWFMDAPDSEILVYKTHIETKAIPKLLLFLKTYREDNQCVCEVVALLRRFAVHKDINSLAFLRAKAMDILVVALLSHISPSEQDVCLFRTLWNCLMDIVLSPRVVAYFREGKQENNDEKYYQRIRLVAAVDLCLDRAGRNICVSWMAQIMDTLRMVLRVDEAITSPTGTTTITKPNDAIRSVLLEKDIARKTQRILNWNDQCHVECELVSLRAVSFFWYCLGDRSDALSESLDTKLLTRFVRTSMREFPDSGYIQETGEQILRRTTRGADPDSANHSPSQRRRHHPLHTFWECASVSSTPEPDILESSQKSVVASQKQPPGGENDDDAAVSWSSWILSLWTRPCDACVDDDSIDQQVDDDYNSS